MQNVLVDLENDLLRVERIPLGSVMFVESPCEMRNFVQCFVTQADISRQSSDCDLMPYVLKV